MGIREATVKRLNELIEEKNLTPHSLALSAAVPPSTLKNILYGQSHNPGIVTIKMLCDGLNISIIEFFNCDLFHNLEQEIQ